MRDLAPLASKFQSTRLLQVHWLYTQGRYVAFAGNADAINTWLRKCLALADTSVPREAAVAFAAHLELAYAEAASNDLTAAEVELKVAGSIPVFAVELPEVERPSR